MVPYFGPGNFRVDGNPYVFLLFEQADADLQVAVDVLARMRNQQTLNVTDAMLSLGLTGTSKFDYILNPQIKIYKNIQDLLKGIS